MKKISKDFDIDSILTSVYTKKSKDWKKVQEKRLVQIFKIAMNEVPAYKDFMAGYSIKPSSVKTYTDFLQIPSVTRKNYLRAFPWNDLCKRNLLVNEPLVMTSTSGSTGAPFYFPRVRNIDLQSSVYHEMFLRSSKISLNKSTLVIDCFGMGVWIGGILTYQAFKYASERGSPLTLITPGVNKKEIYDSLKNLGPHYDQIILCGYPPFMKDLVDEAKEHGIVWDNFNLKMLFAAEGFSEVFRDYMVKKMGISNLYRDITNIYGSADLGTMAEETPICILLRRLALQNQNLYIKLFGQATRLPTLAQYIPDFINFESEGGSIYCTGDNVLPLIRYEIGDSGGVFTYDEVVKICKKEGVDLQKEAKKVGIEDSITELPFVYLYERSDFSTKLYGAIIYPEYIKKGLSIENLEKHVTGKFTMYTKYDDNEDAYLEVNVELQLGVTKTKWLQDEVTEAISLSLIEKSAEHKNNVNMMPKGKVDPRIIFWKYESETHFQKGGKQKWVKNK